MFTKLFGTLVFEVFEHVGMVADFAQLHQKGVEHFAAAVHVRDVLRLEQVLVNSQLHLRQSDAHIDLDFFRQLVLQVLFGPAEHKWTHNPMQDLNDLDFLILVQVLRRVVRVRIEVKPLAEVVLAGEELGH